MDKQFRYPGVRPFQRSQANLFFGRDKDREELLQLVDLDKLTVLYSKSGLGKSSLLNAALLPAVEKAGKLRPFSFRFGAWYKGKEGTPLDVLTHSLAEQAGDEPSFLDEIGRPDMNPLWFYLKKIQIQHPDKTGFLLILDQFEELFSYPQELVRNFGRRLASALYQDIPQSILNNFEKRYQENPQFLTKEEMDLLHQPFDLKVLFAIRSDRLSLLDELTPYLPKILGRLYRLDALSAEAAEEAILNPAYQKGDEFASPRFDYNDQALDYMLDYLTKGRKENIESFQLQILCQYIESELVIEKKLSEVKKEDIGDLDAIYRSYYERQIKRLPNPADIAAARRLIEEGLIEEKDQRRLSLHESQIEQFYGISKELLDQLVETRLLRPEPHYKGGYLYELSHDSIVAPILQAKRERVVIEQQKEAEEEQRKMEQRLKQKEEEAQKEQRRAQTARKANILVGTTVVLAATTGFFYQQNRVWMKESELKAKETSYRADIARQNAESSELTSMALVETEIDRTLAFHLAEAAVQKNPDNQLAVKVRNDVLLRSTFYPFYEKSLLAHQHYISDFAFSPDNKWLVSASVDSTLIIWDLSTFSPVDTLRRHKGPIMDVDFASDGRSILSGDETGLAIIWPFQNGKVNRQQLKSIEYESVIRDVAFAQTPNHILFAGDYKPANDFRPIRHLSVWSLYDNKWINRHIPLHEGSITNVVSVKSQDKTLAITAGADRSVKLLDYRTDSIFYQISDLPANVSNLDYSDGADILVVGLDDGSVHIWEKFSTGARKRAMSFKAHENYISDVVITPDDRRILTCSWDKTAKLWDMQGNLLKVFLGHKDGLRAITISKDQKIVVTGGEDRTMRIWPLKAYEFKSLDLNRAGAPSPVQAVAANGEQLLAGKFEGRALLYGKNGDFVKALDHQGRILDVALSADNKLAATAGLGKQTIRVWDLKKGTSTALNYATAVDAVAFSADGKYLLAGTREKTAILWDLETQDTISVFRGHTANVIDVAFSPKGDRLLTASSDGTARLWSFEGALIYQVRHHSDRVTSVAFHPTEDGVFLTGSWDNTFALWKLDSLKQKFIGHSSDVNKVAFSADGATILSASADRTVRLWTPDGKELESFIYHDDSIIDAVFAPDEEEGWKILTGSKDQTARIWRQKDLETIKQSIAPLTEDQKTKYSVQ
ncbi:MAG: WD40 repeat domain-containing protein [Saprospiraceae bacterium]